MKLTDNTMSRCAPATKREVRIDRRQAVRWLLLSGAALAGCATGGDDAAGRARRPLRERQRG